MGLDMYLMRKTYVQRRDHQADSEKHEVVVKKGGVVRDDIKPERIAYIIEKVAYWRKANCIHKWFVDNCQDGVDDCREAYVETAQLKTLVDVCKEVLASSEMVDGEVCTGYSFSKGERTAMMEAGKVFKDSTVAARLLPNTTGFFFGGQEYDQYYRDQLEDTVAMLEPLTNDDAGFYYNASW